MKDNYLEGLKSALSRFKRVSKIISSSYVIVNDETPETISDMVSFYLNQEISELESEIVYLSQKDYEFNEEGD